MRMFSLITSLVLSLVVLILVITFITGAGKDIRGISDKQTCKQSVELNAALRFEGVTIQSEIKCPTRFIKVKGTEKNVVFETLALALSDTWDEFLGGRREVFETSSEDFCVLRRVVEFKGKERYEGFFDYLLTHTPPNINQPYFTYLTGFSTNEGTVSLQQNLALRKADIINTETPYAAVFLLTKKKNLGKVVGAKIGAFVGGGIGIVTAGTIIYTSGGLGALSSSALVTEGIAAGTYIGGAAGFLLGSKYPANWEAGMLLMPYSEENLKTLKCTKLPIGVSSENKAAGTS